ncbi:TerB family tellurite resistance protein [Microscilla marina]|uniref:Co-chaperone DjlA N-terminal domain-containing protein n=1 Tax=Microscilla marina ATCC 23134 TaxID=313606 RepID=A1ZCL7_MICM2|nr:TerB family tellurite resistance protein [Microscilla marina]EAY32019.1 hypothetical protein M23134_02048 [Microscilla marina ATCC 23134]
MNNGEFSYNQAVFGLMLMGAKADGVLQSEEKRLLVDLTSEEHHLTAEEYKFVITQAKELSDEAFVEKVYATLNNFDYKDRVKALYWLLKLLKSDDSSDDDDQEGNSNEQEIYNKAIVSLGISEEDVERYEREKDGVA